MELTRVLVCYVARTPVGTGTFDIDATVNLDAQGRPPLADVNAVRKIIIDKFGYSGVAITNIIPLADPAS